MSKKVVYNLNFYLTLINFIKQGYNLQQIADHFKISKQTLNPHSKTLQALGILIKRGLVWEVNEKNLDKIINYEPVKAVKKMVIPTKDSKQYKPNTIRGHAFQFTIKIPKEIRGWENRKEFLERRNITTKYYPQHKRVSFKFNNYQIRLYPESITIWFPINASYFHKDNALAVFERAKYDALKLIKRLENFMGISLSIKGNYWLKPSMAHYSLIKNELAKNLEKEGKKLSVRNEKGKEWLIVDNSFQFNELEIQGSGEKPVEQTEIIKSFFNLIAEKPNILLEIIENQALTNKVLEQMDQNIQKITKLVYKQGGYEL